MHRALFPVKTKPICGILNLLYFILSSYPPDMSKLHEMGHVVSLYQQCRSLRGAQLDLRITHIHSSFCYFSLVSEPFGTGLTKSLSPAPQHPAITFPTREHLTSIGSCPVAPVPFRLKIILHLLPIALTGMKFVLPMSSWPPDSMPVPTRSRLLLLLVYKIWVTVWTLGQRTHTRSIASMLLAARLFATHLRLSPAAWVRKRIQMLLPMGNRRSLKSCHNQPWWAKRKNTWLLVFLSTKMAKWEVSWLLHDFVKAALHPTDFELAWYGKAKPHNNHFLCWSFYFLPASAN